MIIRLMFAVMALMSISFGQLKSVRSTALELRNSLVVLTIALEPGDEDFAALDEMKRKKGAMITSVYVTNGESGESDLGSAYPHELAALRREEATSAMESLGHSALFLNVPSSGSVRDTSELRLVWNRDSLEIRLMRAISSNRPDLVVLFPERYVSPPSVQWTALKDGLREAMKRLEEPKDIRGLKRMAGLPVWVVQRAVAGKQQNRINSAGTRIAGQFYKSMRSQQELVPLPEVKYTEVIYPARARSPKVFFEGVVRPPSKGLQNLRTRIERLCDRILNAKGLEERLRQSVLSEMLAVTDSVDYLVGAKYSSFRGPDQKKLLLWKEGLQNLKADLMGVSATYTLEDSILTALQVTTFSVDTVTGVSPGGKLWMFFPAASQGWIINETMEQRHPMVPGRVFSIVSPRELTFNLPTALDGLQQEKTYSPIDFFIVHTDSDRVRNFAKRVRIPFRFAPRFTVEVLTPLVRAVDGETVVVRLTNHSRDGVTDQVGISDPPVVSSRASFRINTKGASATDTLVLQWRDSVALGSYVLPIDIGGIEVARVAARGIEAIIDPSKRVGLVSAGGRSAAFETIRRLGITASRKRPSEVTEEWLLNHDVVVLDHRVYSLASSLKNLGELLRSSANEGVHIIVLSQDALAWNHSPLIPGLSLTKNTHISPGVGIGFNENHTLMAAPNSIRNEDWNAWLFSRATHAAVAPGSAEVAVWTSEGDIPLMISQGWGKGKITFVNLNLPDQWLNIHEGAFRLLANLLAY